MSRTRSTPATPIVEQLVEERPDWFVWDSATLSTEGPYTQEKAESIVAENAAHKDRTFTVVQLPV